MHIRYKTRAGEDGRDRTHSDGVVMVRKRNEIQKLGDVGDDEI